MWQLELDHPNVCPHHRRLVITLLTCQMLMCSSKSLHTVAQEDRWGDTVVVPPPLSDNQHSLLLRKHNDWGEFWELRKVVFECTKPHSHATPVPNLIPIPLLYQTPFPYNSCTKPHSHTTLVPNLIPIQLMYQTSFPYHSCTKSHSHATPILELG